MTTNANQTRSKGTVEQSENVHNDLTMGTYTYQGVANNPTEFMNQLMSPLQLNPFKKFRKPLKVPGSLELGPGDNGPYEVTLKSVVGGVVQEDALPGSSLYYVKVVMPYGVYTDTIPAHKIKNLRHDLSFYALTGRKESQKHLTEFGFALEEEEPYKSGMNGTPDFVEFNSSGHLIVLEHAAPDSNAEAAWIRKTKYESVLDRISIVNNLDVIYGKSIVTANVVLLPLAIGTAFGTTIRRAYITGNIIYGWALGKGLVVEEMSAEDQRILDMYRKVMKYSEWRLPNSSEKPLITRDMVTSWNGMSDFDVKSTVDNFSLQLYDKAHNKIQKLISKDPKILMSEKLADFKYRVKNHYDPDEKIWVKTELTDKPKSVIQLPWLCPRREKIPHYSDKTASTLLRDVYDKHPVLKWAYLCAIHGEKTANIYNNARQFDGATHAEILRSALEAKALTKEERKVTRENLRVIGTLPMHDKQELALKGINAKKFGKTKKELEEERKKTPQFFSLDTSTDDIKIHTMKSKKYYLEDGPADWDPIIDYNELRKLGTPYIPKMKNWSREIADGMMRSRLGCCFLVLDIILQELNVSMKSFSGDDKYVMKKAARGLWVLCKAVGETKNIYFTVIADRSIFELPQEQIDPTGKVFKPSLTDESTGVIVFDVLSLERHRISHLLGSYAMMSVLTMFNEYYHEPVTEWRNSSDSSWGHFIYSVLIYLEDKGKTSETMLTTRHFCQEFVKFNELPPDPMKIFESHVPTLTRSRLQIDIINGFINAAEKMLETPPTVVYLNELSSLDDQVEDFEVPTSSDRYRGLVSPVCGLDVPSIGCYLEIGYTGCFHNKDEGDMSKGNSKINNKIVQEELKLPEANLHKMGFGDEDERSWDIDDLKSHEFSTKWVSRAGDLIRNRISKEKGLSERKDYDHWFEKRFSKVISFNPAEDFATMKASAEFPTVRKIVETAGNMIEGIRERRKFWKAMRLEGWHEETEVKAPFDPQRLLASCEAPLKNLVDYSKEKVTSEDYPKRGGKGGRSHLNASRPKIRNVRNKALLNMAKLLTANKITALPLNDILSLVDELEMQGGVLVNLFKKLQLQGVREIFVLCIYSRISIKFVESISRMLCEEMYDEMLTKGDVKYKRHSQHMSNLKNFGYESQFTATNSTDATAWCQQFVMPLFGTLLSRVCPEPILKIVLRVLNCVATKRIELSTQMLQEIIENSKKKGKSIHSLTDLSFNTLIDEILNFNLNNRLLTDGPHCMFYKNFSNMMQGILHYTSSLLHCGHVMVIADQNELLWPSLVKAAGIDQTRWKLHQTHMVSSDDSSAIYSATTKHKDVTVLEKSIIRRSLTILCYSMALSAPLICARTSFKKSIVGCHSNMIEFNSSWQIGTQSWNPRCKFIYAGFHRKTTSSMIGRLENSSNLLKACVENGCSIFNTALLQEFQARSHYDQLGMIMSPIFRDFAKMIHKSPHPSVGLFLYQPEFFAGLFGLDFPYYFMCSDHELTFKIERTLLKLVDPSIDETGRPSTAIFIKFGESTKYERLVKDMEKEGGFQRSVWRMIGNKNPQMLIERTETVEQAFHNIYQTLTSPGVQDSLGFSTGNTSYAASVYILSKACVTYKSTYENGVRKFESHSLLQVLDIFNKNIQNLPDINEDVLMSFLFPAREFYENMRQVLNTIDSSQYTMSDIAAERALRLTSVQIPHYFVAGTTDLITCIKRYWFNLKVGVSESVVRAAMEIYKWAFPIIKDTLKATLDTKRFEDATMLMAWVKSTREKTKSIKILGVPGWHNSITTLFERAACRNYLRGKELLLSRTPYEVSLGLRKARAAMTYLLLGPVLPGRFQRIIAEAILKQNECIALRKRLSKSDLKRLQKQKREENKREAEGKFNIKLKSAYPNPLDSGKKWADTTEEDEVDGVDFKEKEEKHSSGDPLLKSFEVETGVERWEAWQSRVQTELTRLSFNDRVLMMMMFMAQNDYRVTSEVSNILIFIKLLATNAFYYYTEPQEKRYVNNVVRYIGLGKIELYVMGTFVKVNIDDDKVVSVEHAAGDEVAIGNIRTVFNKLKEVGYKEGNPLSTRRVYDWRRRVIITRVVMSKPEDTDRFSNIIEVPKEKFASDIIATRKMTLRLHMDENERCLKLCVSDPETTIIRFSPDTDGFRGSSPIYSLSELALPEREYGFGDTLLDCWMNVKVMKKTDLLSDINYLRFLLEEFNALSTEGVRAPNYRAWRNNGLLTEMGKRDFRKQLQNTQFKEDLAFSKSTIKRFEPKGLVKSVSKKERSKQSTAFYVRLYNLNRSGPVIENEMMPFKPVEDWIAICLRQKQWLKDTLLRSLDIKSENLILLDSKKEEEEKVVSKNEEAEEDVTLAAEDFSASLDSMMESSFRTLEEEEKKEIAPEDTDSEEKSDSKSATEIPFNPYKVMDDYISKAFMGSVFSVDQMTNLEDIGEELIRNSDLSVRLRDPQRIIHPILDDLLMDENMKRVKVDIRRGKTSAKRSDKTLDGVIAWLCDLKEEEKAMIDDEDLFSKTTF